MNRCRLCDQERELVRAHAIPESFFRVLRSEGEIPLLVSNAKDPFPKRAPIGVYDNGILCGECERKFGHVDNYASEILINRFEELFKPVVHGDRIALQAEGVDQELLLRFLVATLWRASVATHQFYRRVRLGKYEIEARRAIDLASSMSDSFAAVLSSWPAPSGDVFSAHGLMDPFQERWDGVNAYRLYLGRVVAYIKVDRRPFAYPLSDLTLGRHEVLSIVQRDFETSKDFAVMAKAARESHRRAQATRASRRS
jgi:hypothetical protein